VIAVVVHLIAVDHVLVLPQDSFHK
jgi:hypothetical protein